MYTRTPTALVNKVHTLVSKVVSKRADKKEQTRRAIVNAALQLSAGRGFSSVSLRAIAKEAGIAPNAFYKHFKDLDDLGLALVDQVGLSLRQLVREARRRVNDAGDGSVVRTSIQTFMEFLENNSDLFRLLLGEGAGSTPAFRNAIRKEVNRFTLDLVEDLKREAATTNRPVAHPELAAEAMVTVAFNLGAGAIDLPKQERLEVLERVIQQVRIIMRGAEAMAAGWNPAAP